MKRLSLILSLLLGLVTSPVYAVPITELAVAPMKGFGIFELYRQMAEEQTLRETALIAAPNVAQQRQNAILAERQRYAAFKADRLPTAAESAAHVREIDDIVSGRHAGA